MAMGINNLLEIFNEKYYENLEGGILESFGRLFRNSVKLYIYPMRQDAYEAYIAAERVRATASSNNAFVVERPDQREERQDRRPPLEPLRPPAREPLHRLHRRLRLRHPEHLLARRPAPHQGEGPDLGDDGARRPSSTPSSAGASSATPTTRSSTGTSKHALPQVPRPRATTTSSSTRRTSRPGRRPSTDQIRVICHRNFGIGSDGILWGPLPSAKADFGLRIFNPDGSEAEKSGNGLQDLLPLPLGHRARRPALVHDRDPGRDRPVGREGVRPADHGGHGLGEL